MRIIELNDTSHDALHVYGGLTEAQLRQCGDDGLFIAESPKVIKVALDAGLEPMSVLCERRHIEGDAAPVLARCGDIPVFTGDRALLASLTGYTLTRGVLCAMRRPKPRTAADVCRDARRVVVIDDVSDTTNIGAIFRSAAALGVDGVLLGPTACDPLNRRAVRVSMGTVFLVPWARLDGGVESLRGFGLKTAAMALRDDSVSLDDPGLNAEPRLAIIMGTEGEGLPQSTIDACDYTVRIPMSYGIDSLNVAAAAAVACWQLRPR